MCGIAGIIEHKENRALVEHMCQSMVHRGPDGSSVYAHETFTMGHVRLAVIDLETGDQPIYNEDRSLSITFNGEIYNYQGIREALIKRGHTLSTQSDTEVILHLFEEKGTAAFTELNGYFAFALCDHQSNELYLVRDQFGIKPLHFYTDSNKFLYGSEIKCILTDRRIPRVLNREALHHQLNLRYNQTNETLFKNIHRLPPAHFIKVKSDASFTMHNYYKLSYSLDTQSSEEEFCEQIRDHLGNAVKRQMVSDVPVGLYLSGGIDSGSLVALAAQQSSRPIKTFTLGFNEPTDEFDEAKLVAEMYGTEHHELRMTPNPLGNMETAIWHAEEPKINLLQGYMMSHFLKDHVTVALSGLGGDELFGGYDIYKYISPAETLFKYTPQIFEPFIGKPTSALLFHAENALGHLPFNEYRRGLEMATSVGNLSRFYLILRNAWDSNTAFAKQIYHPSAYNNFQVSDAFKPLFEHPHKTATEQVQWVEFQSKMLNDYLLTEDRMSMANHIEQRVPFLDKELVEFAFSIPTKFKLKHGTTKYILRKAMRDMLPKQNIQKPKWGFTFNPYLQFQKDLKQKALEVLTEDRIQRDQLFNYAYIKKILDSTPHPKMRWHYNYIWLLVGFYIWKEQFEVKV